MGKEKKEIGKLLELLNEYAKELGIGDYVGWHNKETVENSDYIFTKKFGFIKWLVDNDKIEKGKIDTRLVKSVESHYDVDGWWVENSYEDYSDTDTLLMLLSISDTPIEDLLLYLK